MPEHCDHVGKAFLPVGVDVKSGIIQETRAGAQADPAVAHVV